MASTTSSRENARSALAARAQEQKRLIEEKQRADTKAVTDFFTVADKVSEWEERLGETTAGILDGGMSASYLSDLVGWPAAKLSQLAAAHRARAEAPAAPAAEKAAPKETVKEAPADAAATEQPGPGADDDAADGSASDAA